MCSMHDIRIHRCRDRVIELCGYVRMYAYVCVCMYSMHGAKFHYLRRSLTASMYVMYTCMYMNLCMYGRVHVCKYENVSMYVYASVCENV
jgi:hypothetical protein